MEDTRDGNQNAPLALIALVMGFALGLIVAWILWVQRKEEQELSEASTVGVERLELERKTAAPAPEPAAEAEPDDLTRIEGIGPKISSVLQDAGILTFRRLAESKPDELRRILREEDERLAWLADPGTWAEQAGLAATGDWDALEELQEALTAGRRA